MSTPKLDRIAREGNRPPLSSVAAIRTWRGDRDNWIVCRDGFKVSVIAGDGTYCSPRPSAYASLGEVAADYPGPYTAVEVGYPSQRPEPWDEWQKHVEDPSAPTDTVYGQVPVELVRTLIESHGGEA